MKTKTKEEIITDAEIDAVWGNADFGDVARRKVIDDSVADVASGNKTGHTVTCILQELQLTNKSGALTLLGYQYLWVLYRPVVARISELEKAIIALFANPWGCPMCDSGVLRDPGKEHWGNCPFDIVWKLMQNRNP